MRNEAKQRSPCVKGKELTTYGPLKLVSSQVNQGKMKNVLDLTSKSEKFFCANKKIILFVME